MTAGPALQTNIFKGFMERNELRPYMALVIPGGDINIFILVTVENMLSVCYEHLA